MNNNYIFLSGMLRTGSNLLSSILNQNENIYSEGISALCNILWDFNLSVSEESVINEFKAVNKYNNKKMRKMGLSIFDSYYEKENKIIFDKNPSWTLTSNINLLKKYVIDKPKIIVLSRNIEDSAKSYINVLLQNDFSQEQAEQAVFNFDTYGTNPLMRPVSGVMNSIINKDLADFFYIDYDDLILNTEKAINDLYKFCNIPLFSHQYEKIETKYSENADEIFKNMIEVREKISKRKLEINLSDRAINKTKEIQEFLDKIKLNPEDEEIKSLFRQFYLFNTY